MRRGTLGRAVLPVAIALVVGMTQPSTATAVPVAGQQIQAVPAASQQEKAKALTELGIEPTPALLRLTDRNFVFEVWKIATGAEVRASAELAMVPSNDDACTQWIKTGAKEARARDRANEQRDVETARLALELKRNGAAAIYLTVVEYDVLLRSYRDFVYWLCERAPGPKVKQAAWAAFEGTEEAQKEFLRVGIFEMHAQDQQDKRDADQEKSEAEKAVEAWNATKSAAAARVGLVPNASLLVLPDDGFIWEIWERSTQGSEVYLAATNAVRSKDPAVWKEFIQSGVHAAYGKDRQNTLAKRDEDNRRRAQQIGAKATNSMVRPALAEAARVALAGTPDDVERFLAVGQHQALGQSLGAVKAGNRGSYISEPNGAVVPATTQPTFAWKIMPGLADPNCVSLESPTRPDFYVMQSEGEVYVRPSDDTDGFRRNATWCARPGALIGAGVSLESVGRPGAFLRHKGGLVAGKNGPYCVPTGPPQPGQLPGEICQNRDHPDYFAVEATWTIDAPKPPETTEITRRYLNDDAIHARLGNPVAAEEVDGAVRFRDYAKGRLYWSARTGVKQLEGLILAEYRRIGAHRAANFGPPTTDETGTPDKVGRYNHFVDGGSIYWTPNTGAHETYGPIKAKWASLDWERSYLKYPTSGVETVGAIQRQLFQGGRIEYDPATGKTTAYRP
ncbi:AbfB domain-containing protein [Amycolatopsis sp. NPDC089917]|uniref:AbfB domain-containing protein n=1 Tax=Amycolatopsis sp. NPDC089917 TaxID=3155187 RepID=UPI00341D58D5